MRFSSGLLAIVAILPARAHYIFSSITVNGVKTQPYEYVRDQSNSNSPITDVTSQDMRCNKGGLLTGSKTKTYSLAPGSQVTAVIDWDVMGHPGPVNVYMAKAPGLASEYDGSGQNWFRIWETRPSSYDPLVFPFTGASEIGPFTIPAQTPPGEYLLRIEHIALHGAGTVGGAQFYIECAQIKVTGNGTGSPGPLVSIPGVYSATDPAIHIGIYWPPVTSYAAPGPAIWGGGGTSQLPVSSVRPTTSSVRPSSSSSSSVRPSSSSSVRPSSSSTRPSSSAAPSSTPSTGGAPLYGQCGGVGWTGPTTCASGTCKKSNDFYSQCLP